MQKLEKILNANLKKYKLEDRIKAAEVLKTWQKIVSDFFPDAVGKTMALSLKNGVLTVASLSREIADAIMLVAGRIIYELNRLVGKSLVYRICCEV